MEVLGRKFPGYLEERTLISVAEVCALVHLFIMKKDLFRRRTADGCLISFELKKSDSRGKVLPTCGPALFQNTSWHLFA
jgi:hypothetical protein